MINEHARFRRPGLGVSAVVAMAMVVSSAPAAQGLQERARAQAGLEQTELKTFEFLGRPERFTIPSRVCSLVVEAFGGEGGTAVYGAPGGKSAGVQATIKVTPGRC
jgi:hypothetical protein